MAIIGLWTDGFDLYGDSADMLSNYTSYSGSPVYDSVGGFRGGGAITASAGAAWAVCKYGSEDANSVEFSCRLTLSELPAAGSVELFHLRNNDSANLNASVGNTHGALAVNSSGQLVIIGAFTSVLATSASQVIFPNTPHYIEIRVERFRASYGNANGDFWVYVDGVLAVSKLNDRVLTLSFPATNYVVFGWDSASGEAVYDDIHFTIGHGPDEYPLTLGVKEILTRFPTEDLAQADWSLSVGVDGYACIDEPGGSNGDSDYIFSATVGHKSEFEFSDVMSSISVQAVSIKSSTRKTDAGAITYRSYINSSSSIGNGATVPPSTSYAQYTDVFLNDPATGSSWAASAVNAAKVGVEVVS